ncbi:MAG: oligosaccharide flippase family protein [Hyphomonadaceae bacterium]
MNQPDPAGVAPGPSPTARSRVSAMMQRAVLWSSLNVIFSHTAATAIFLVIAAQLPVHIFGVVALATVVADFVAMEGRYAAKDAIIQAGRFDTNSLNTAFTAFLALVALTIVALAVLAPFVGSIYNEPLVGTFMALFGLMLVPVPWMAVMDALMLRDLKYRQMTERTIVATLAGGAVGIALAFSPWFLWAIPAQRVFGQLVQIALLYKFTRWAPGISLHWASAVDFMKRFFSLWLVKTLVITIGRLTSLVFGLRYDVATVGLLRANNRIAEAVQAPVISPLIDLWFPLMSKVRGDVDGEREVYNSIVRTATVVALPIFAGLAITAHDVAALLLPEQYSGVGPILQASAITYLLIPILWFNNVALNSMGLNKLSLSYTIALVALSLLVLFASTGATPTQVILLMSAPAAVVGIVGNVILNRRLQQTNLAYYSGLFPPVLATAAMSAVTLTVSYGMKDFNAPLRLSTCVVAGAASYFGWLIAFHRSWFMDCVRLLINRRTKPA